MIAIQRDLLPSVATAIAVPQFDVVQHLANERSVPDSTEKYILRVGRSAWILIISSAASPLTIQRAVTRQREAKSALQSRAAEAIELPVTDGFYEERSYALWTMRRPVSSNRVLFALDKWRLAPRVYGWLREVAGQTARPADASVLAANAARLAQVSELPPPIRLAADKASNAFLSGQVPALQVLQHGDLWIGNVLKSPSALGFVVIDWPGARFDGSPFFDLVKFANSIQASKTALRNQIEAHCAVLHCQPEHALAYVLSGLGQLNSVLEHFPMTMFVELCRRKFQALAN